ncbi:hypothetical protein [Microtetraspora niveoalba]|uniref:hypothetical protein n=1 Tax=Microtetraspora niveoalba TaxID=46175 RepID=UPI0008378ADA|nr:hypothetical protein [Microtetraspora niveoalba]
MRLSAAVAAAAVVAAPGEEMTRRFSITPGDLAASSGAIDARVRERYFGPDAWVCERHGPVAYCAYRDYVAWIPAWVSAVDPVVRALPPAERDRPREVRQLTDSWWLADRVEGRDVETFPVWGRAGAEGDSRGVLASDVVRSVTGLRPPSAGCDARGQGRAVVALWLL